MPAPLANHHQQDSTLDAEVSAVIEDLMECHDGFEGGALRTLARNYLALRHAYDALAADAIAAIVEHRIKEEEDLPEPSAAQPGEHLIALPAQLAAKAAVYRAWKASGLRKTELARMLGRNEGEVRRILDPKHGTKLAQLDEAARALGGSLAVEFRPQAAG